MAISPDVLDWMFNDRRRNHSYERSATGGPLPDKLKRQRAVPKNECPHCGKVVGRGIGLHVRKCAKNPNRVTHDHAPVA